MKVKLLNKDAILPTKAHETDAGFDIYATYDFTLYPIIEMGYVGQVETGIAIEVPDGKFCLVKERSSLALRGMVITAGVIDYGYRGEIIVICHNVSCNPLRFNRGDKIAQLIVLPYYGNRAEEVESVSKTKRGEKGFGSSDNIESTPTSPDEIWYGDYTKSVEEIRKQDGEREILEEEVAIPTMWECKACGQLNRNEKLYCLKCGVDRGKTVSEEDNPRFSGGIDSTENNKFEL